jgi:hypothetical protein
LSVGDIAATKVFFLYRFGYSPKSFQKLHEVGGRQLLKL